MTTYEQQWLTFSTVVDIRFGSLVAANQTSHVSDSQHTSCNVSFAKILQIHTELTGSHVVY
jgi:hypothetical protein